MLLIDEIDRADDEFEAFLLEVLSDYAVTIPELGTVRAQTPPLVIVTSNRTRDVHDALKRRCLYHWLDHPARAREVAILRRRVPDLSPRLAEQVAYGAARLRGLGLVKPPGSPSRWTGPRSLQVLGAGDAHGRDRRRVARRRGEVPRGRGDGHLPRPAAPPSGVSVPTAPAPWEESLVGFGQALRRAGVAHTPTGCAPWPRRYPPAGAHPFRGLLGRPADLLLPRGGHPRLRPRLRGVVRHRPDDERSRTRVEVDRPVGEVDDDAAGEESGDDDPGAGHRHREHA